MRKSYQVGALPIRRNDAGALEVLLVTTRGTQRWVVPKGWPWRRHADHDAAAGEAWEEAGVRGRTAPQSIGSFTYDKIGKSGSRRLEVLVYVLEVTDEADHWPEAQERRRDWFSPQAAIELVTEPGLKSLLQALDTEAIEAQGA